eukprot:scaffold670037_cov158-Prasinocladus_malaysianus.AAC.1
MDDQRTKQGLAAHQPVHLSKDLVKRHVRHVAPPPAVMAESFKTVMNRYQNAVDGRLLLFSSEMPDVFDRTLSLITQGKVSDPPSEVVEFYQELPSIQESLASYVCSRGSNPCETLHSVQNEWVPGTR